MSTTHRKYLTRNKILSCATLWWKPAMRISCIEMSKLHFVRYGKVHVERNSRKPLAASRLAHTAACIQTNAKNACTRSATLRTNYCFANQPATWSLWKQRARHYIEDYRDYCGSKQPHLLCSYFGAVRRYAIGARGRRTPIWWGVSAPCGHASVGRTRHTFRIRTRSTSLKNIQVKKIVTLPTVLQENRNFYDTNLDNTKIFANPAAKNPFTAVFFGYFPVTDQNVIEMTEKIKSIRS